MILQKNRSDLPSHESSVMLQASFSAEFKMRTSSELGMVSVDPHDC